MENVWLTGLYLLGLLSVIFSMRLYIRFVGKIANIIVWASLLASLAPYLNYATTAIYLSTTAIVLIARKIEDIQTKRVGEGRRSFLEHLLGAEQDYFGNYRHKEKEKNK